MNKNMTPAEAAIMEIWNTSAPKMQPSAKVLLVDMYGA